MDEWAGECSADRHRSRRHRTCVPYLQRDVAVPCAQLLCEKVSAYRRLVVLRNLPMHKLIDEGRLALRTEAGQAKMTSPVTYHRCIAEEDHLEQRSPARNRIVIAVYELTDVGLLRLCGGSVISPRPLALTGGGPVLPQAPIGGSCWC